MAKQQLKIQVALKSTSTPAAELNESLPPFSKRKIVAALLLMSAGITGFVHAISDEKELATDTLHEQLESVPNERVLIANDIDVELAAETKGDTQTESSAEVATDSVEQVADDEAGVDTETQVEVNNDQADVANTDRKSTEGEDIQDSSRESSTDVATAEPEPKVEISRLVLTRGIKDREPIDEIKKSLPAQAAKSLTLYVFSELKNYQGKQVTHRWFFKDKLMSETELKVDNTQWRTWSSKRILWKWQGNWRVEVVDEQGQILKTKYFKYGI